MNTIQKLFITSGAMYALCSAYYLNRYYTSPKLDEIDTLRNTAAYIQAYDGENSAALMKHLRTTLDDVANNSEGVHVSGISELEAELSQINSQIETSESPKGHMSQVSAFSEKVEDVAKKNVGSSNSGNPITLLSGLFLGLSSIVSFGACYKERDCGIYN